ncbi:Uncharacterised protein [Arthrobacter agilis]|uniref:hypothetical protein n=1 Tax=Arthrobacter agilis TaxID=37921 RepID=UPI000B358A7B|nr:hypothetical protein [Arthrobacter agilis]OUM40708.1 hypothetical protein B8W74_14585 [Arthrobacter agilis]VDR31282.1 Uncharacterised protein [Arthrobacter agilis]
MTESSSSAGHPDGAALPADHPLGPAVPIPPRDEEAQDTGAKDTRAKDDTGNDVAPGSDDGAPATHEGADQQGDDGRPEADRREDVLDPGAGSADHHAASIRDEQGTHSAGTVPAAYNGDGTPDNPEEDGHPEEAAAEPERWDSGGAAG